MDAKGYKAVRKFNNDYYSIYAKSGDWGRRSTCDNYTLPDETCFHYQLDVWYGRPKGCGPFAVFDSYDTATEFLWREMIEGSCVILPCSYEKSNEHTLFITIDGVKYSYLRELPSGTVLADKVRLEEQRDGKRDE